ncbi:hypothetical protein DEO72_LG1g2894 [Vigna unguiculata]|uniref:Uncharacterized protein n=1 Tax=Vigna unguiculata TaxID=3917 RepID=A0A4D6KRU0_VIGUN|nr:hypothetical protein DEO72_LG1g2894 [Vigna unguiculata]
MLVPTPALFLTSTTCNIIFSCVKHYTIIAKHKHIGPQLVETRERISCYRPRSATPGGVPNTNHNLYSQHKINTSLAITCECSIKWRPSVQATTHTLTTVSLTVLSHNSRDTILSHNSMNALVSPSLRYHPKPYKPRTSITHNAIAPALSPSVALEPPSESQLHTAWRNPYTTRCFTPLMPLSLQVSPGKSTLTARRHASQWGSGIVVIAWQFQYHHQSLHQYNEFTSYFPLQPYVSNFV